MDRVENLIAPLYKEHEALRLKLLDAIEAEQKACDHKGSIVSGMFMDVCTRCGWDNFG
jgi:hypothetical protein